MDNKLKTRIVLLSLALLSACNSNDDSNTISSNGYVTPTDTTSDTETTVTEEEILVEESDSSESTDVTTNSLINGNFESWTDNIPDGWTTIEDGISVAENSEIAYLDSSSAAINVTTATQGDTDFRQYVDVVANTTYTFSAWVYHTEGYVKARIYVDDYQGYSDSDLINQWQEISYEYTPTESKSIEVGLRFYDQTGFDDQEIVYVDNLSLTADSATQTTDSDESEESDSAAQSETTSSEEGESDTTNETEAGLLVNGDFENWTASLPDDWTTIDSGITVTQTSDIYSSGSSAAAINVLTDSQGSTDIRQSVDVVADLTYTFSAAFYHTEGNVKARLFVGSYADYSDNSVVNQWQTLTYSYTPTASGTIEVGVRFYDQSGFDGEEIVYIDNFSLIADSTTTDTTAYYANADGLTGLQLKTALYNIIKDHTTKSYSDLWDFMSESSLDYYYENDGSILDIYSENPSSSDSYNYTAITDQCGNYSGEGSCYNREHSFPKSWFDDGYPMYTDIHHIFASDGYVNGKRSNYPYGEVSTSSYVSDNGSKLGAGSTALGYTGTVFEPIDQFKGDLARAYFYMATRYQDVISTWESNSESADAVLDGSNDYVFEDWVITMLKDWNELDQVSQEELDRNEAAYQFQGNRNPFVDHPEYINQIWAD